MLRDVLAVILIPARCASRSAFPVETSQAPHESVVAFLLGQCSLAEVTERAYSADLTREKNSMSALLIYSRASCLMIELWIGSLELCIRATQSHEWRQTQKRLADRITE